MKTALILLAFYFSVSNGLMDPIDAKLTEIPTFKTIETEYGETFDCINITQQPAFRHPRLKNHKIQMTPSSIPDSIDEKSTNSCSEVKISKIDCPPGTVPIRRNSGREKTGFTEMFQHNISAIIEGTRVHMAKYYKDGNGYGTKASVTVYEPKVGGKYSGAWLLVAGEGTRSGFIVGWDVSPNEYGDYHAHFGSDWGDLASKTGCKNLKCPGFVQVASDIALGSRLSPVSTYNGKQHQITLHVFKDPKTGNWWLAYGENKKAVGYWPKSLFTEMDKVSQIAWVGLVVVAGDELSYPMGSGHFPSEGLGRSAFFQILI
ncbi:hypothetical protein LUZ60_000131 [Juncus effusus]|nr:hypothetical protein LUZ60_000131 [Juncus effusus]